MAKVTTNGASLHRNGTTLTFVPPNPNKYFLYTPTTIAYNQNNLWTAQAAVGNAFIPPTGSTIHLVAQMWATSGVAASGNFVAKWIKNATIDGSSFQITATLLSAVQRGVTAVNNMTASMKLIFPSSS